MKYNLIYGKNIISATEFLAIAKSLGWAKKKYDIYKVRNALKNSLWIVAIRDINGKLIGCSRVFSDDLFFSTIPDIFVVKEHQRKGLGNLMLSKIKRRFGHTKIFFGVRPGMEKFYEKAGFKRSMPAFEVKNVRG